MYLINVLKSSLFYKCRSIPNGFIITSVRISGLTTCLLNQTCNNVYFKLNCYWTVVFAVKQEIRDILTNQTVEIKFIFHKEDRREKKYPTGSLKFLAYNYYVL